MGEWQDCMRRGDFEAAWRFSDRVIDSGEWRASHHLPRHYQCIWDGRPVMGRRVLVRCYHGLGDTIQFARYLPLLARSASVLSVWAQPQLLPLLSTMGTTFRLLPLHDGEPGGNHEVDAEITELPYMFRTTI